MLEGFIAGIAFSILFGGSGLVLWFAKRRERAEIEDWEEVSFHPDPAPPAVTTLTINRRTFSL